MSQTFLKKAKEKEKDLFKRLFGNWAMKKKKKI